MSHRPQRILHRRRFLTSTSAALAGVLWSKQIAGAERPAVTNPRATSGDTAVEPKWNERLTITVGPQKADLVGADDRVLQAAVD